MKLKINLFLAVLLIFICCTGAASAADGINDDALSTDADLDVVEQVDDVALEINNDEDELSTVIPQSVSSWTDLKSYSQSTTADYEITVANGTYNVGSDSITFGNNAKIIGSGNTVITGGSSSVIPFQGNGKSITFSNLIFRNMNSDMVIKLVDSGSSKIENCVFENIVTSTSGQKSVVYNNGGYMKITNSNFTNCNTTYGVITNHKTPTTALMDVENCRFINNRASVEPGAINNCGIMNVTDSVFNYNRAAWWAGAIHTHTNAKSIIKRCSFTGNIAGWNGGALYTYSTLIVCNSNFTDNNCSTNNGGGAIGASNYFFASNAYNVTIKCCNFVNNHNLASNGYGGAIAAMNGGTLTVTCSNFTRNSADNGQAICGFNTNEYANISEGNAHLVITNNNFINHDIKTGTTVKLEGDYYTFEDNTFTNSPQIAYNDDNDYDTIITASSPNIPYSINEITVNSKNDVLGASFEEIIGESEVIYISQEDIDKSKSALNNAIQNAKENTTIIIRSGTTITRASSTYSATKNITVIGENRETVLVTSHAIRSGDATNENNTWTWVNVTFKCSIDLSNTNYKFINCTFVNSLLQFDGARSSLTDPDVTNYAFKNCEFVNYTQNNVVVANKFANVIILDCAFDNVTADAIVSTDANRTDDSGRQAGVTIKDSTFKDVTVKGIVKAQDYSVAAVTTDNKYDFATQKTLASDDVVYVDVPVNATTLTVKVADIKEGEDFTIDVTLSNNLTANVTVVINKQEYNVSVVNGNGSLKVSDKLAANTYDVEASFKGLSPYAASTNTTTFKVEKVSAPASDKDKQTTTPKVTKKATKITAKKATFKAKKKTKKYTIVLKSGKKVVKKVKVTLKVGKKTYKATTNSKGKATFKITKLNKKGKYNAVIKFAGNKNFKATSKKVKITVKK